MITTSKELKEHYKDLVNDSEFDGLELKLSKPNIFDVLKITTSEIRHTNFLGWLFDPNESHGLNDLLLKRFLREIFSNERLTEISEFDVELIDLRKVEVRREWRNIDLLLIFDKVVVCVENKLYSKEHTNQLKRYREIVEEGFPKHKKVFVYLTLFGETSEKDDDIYINYSHEELIELLHKVSTTFRDNISAAVQTYLNDYIVSIKRHFMKNEEVNDLAKRIYLNHKEIFDFVFANMPDFENELRTIIEEEVVKKGWVLGSANKGYVRFLTPELDKFIPRGLATGWPNKEAFLFEINFFWYPKKLKLQTTVADSKHQIHNILDDIISKLDGAKKPQGKKWLVHFSEDKPFDKEKLQEESADEIRKVVKQYLDDFGPTVKKVAEAITKNKDKIK